MATRQPVSTAACCAVGRLPVSDRAALNGILLVLKTRMRYNGPEYLAADISDEHEASVGHSLTFLIGDDLNLSLNVEEPAVSESRSPVTR
ncbi:hypothetical protein [Ralstonia flaminis]|jgi:hypothetical protein|uniref:Uncharacterized protein n=1 Tax=Ralstonia flaminis TaxID=3058597 RepID=A0ABN9JME1_9RALS|nr:hypothetical protein [Ralstonia sp. LMG 18101]CAJ0813666.1 hypothetical protein LMG18101_01991 [Ralstonia sp. LMG 18101]